jgi:translation initiation factor 3 subunit D
MTAKNLVDLVDSCPPDDGWGCSVTSDITLNGVPYAPFSKGDKLSRVADWSSDSKDRDGRGRGQYGRNYRGRLCSPTLDGIIGSPSTPIFFFLCFVLRDY